MDETDRRTPRRSPRRALGHPVPAGPGDDADRGRVGRPATRPPRGWPGWTATARVDRPRAPARRAAQPLAAAWWPRPSPSTCPGCRPDHAVARLAPEAAALQPVLASEDEPRATPVGEEGLALVRLPAEVPVIAVDALDAAGEPIGRLARPGCPSCASTARPSSGRIGVTHGMGAGIGAGRWVQGLRRGGVRGRLRAVAARVDACRARRAGARAWSPTSPTRPRRPRSSSPGPGGEASPGAAAPGPGPAGEPRHRRARCPRGRRWAGAAACCADAAW